MKYSVVLSSLFLCAGLALGQANNDYRPAAGAYGAATNWTLGHVPDSNDVARIGVTNNQAIAHASGVLTAGALVMGGSTRTGTLTVSGGELSYAAPSIVGTNGSIAGIVNNGGLLIFSNGLTLASSTGTATYASLTNNSGTVRVEGNLQVAIHLAGGGGARGMLTVNGGTVTVTGDLATANAAAYSYIRLNGGVLEVAGVTHAGSATERVLFFNGGTLRALQDNTNFLPVAANARADDQLGAKRRGGGGHAGLLSDGTDLPPARRRARPAACARSVPACWACRRTTRSPVSPGSLRER
jgi:hypothetical protein